MLSFRHDRTDFFFQRLLLVGFVGNTQQSANQRFGGVCAPRQRFQQQAGGSPNKPRVIQERRTSNFGDCPRHPYADHQQDGCSRNNGRRRGPWSRENEQLQRRKAADGRES